MDPDFQETFPEFFWLPQSSVIVCRKQDHQVGGGLGFWMIWKRFHWRKGDPFQGLRVGSDTQKWIIRGDIHADKRKTLLGGGALVESSRARAPSCHMAHSLWVYGNAVGFSVVSGQSSCLLLMCGLNQESFSAKVDSSVRVSGRLVGCTVSSLLLLTLLQISGHFWL